MIITCVVGERHCMHLGVLVESVLEVCGRVDVAVVHQDVPRAELCRLREMGASLVAADPPIRADHPLDAIPLKTLLWRQGYSATSDEQIAFLDCDIVLRRPLDDFFRHGFDVAYTYKTHVDENLDWPLNTGVILARRGEGAGRFFDLWSRRTTEIMGDDQAMSRAAGEWGAADQAALGEMLGTRRAEDYAATRTREGITFVGFRCAELNETRCVPLMDSQHAIHYKGRWRPVLPDGRFTRWRPEDKCREQYDLWRRLYERWHKRRAEQAGQASRGDDDVRDT